MLNSSLATGIVPSFWKQSKILPLLKKPSADPNIPTNYRPISLLSAFSKVLEKHVNKVIMEYAKNHNLLHPTQLGFRDNYSNETAHLEVTEHLKEKLDQGGRAILILLDLLAVFDTVPHMRLLVRLRNMGFGGRALDWISSYLEDRE